MDNLWLIVLGAIGYSIFNFVKTKTNVANEVVKNEETKDKIQEIAKDVAVLDEKIKTESEIRNENPLKKDVVDFINDTYNKQ